MTAVERWLMPSGRIGTIDLTQPAPAVEALRELLASQGATRITEESAPAPVAAEDEGEDQNTNQQEGDQIVSDSTENTHIRESIRAWAAQYAAKTDEAARVAVNDPDFQEWAAEQLHRRPEWTIDKCARRWVDENGLVSVPWPVAVSPSGWNVDIGPDLGGEVAVSVDYEIDDPEVPAVGAALGVLITVVVDVDPARTRPEPGVEVGDYFVSLPTISYWGVENTSDADADRLAALSRVLLRTKDALPAAAGFSRLLGGSERSQEIPVGKLAEETEPVDPPMSAEEAQGALNIAQLLRDKGAANLGELFEIQQREVH